MTPSSVFWNIFRPLLYILTPETAHALSLLCVKLLWRLHPGLVRLLAGTRTANKLPEEKKTITIAGIVFEGPIGLAAGFDKNGEWLPFLPDLGFHFAEIGTVTPLPQAGNTRPRLFRIIDRQALFNCMGFNNDGAEAIAQRVRSHRMRLPKNFKLGINIGKNKATPLDAALQDYSRVAEQFRGLADFFVINISSPNTPGLRSLQNLDFIRAISDHFLALQKTWSQPIPLFLKLAPDFETEEFRQLISGLTNCSAFQAVILTNTTQGTWKGLTGGWSGEPTRLLSEKRLTEAVSISKIPIISSGGIMNPEVCHKRLKLGATLVEIYTGWIYYGPRLIRDFYDRWHL